MRKPKSSNKAGAGGRKTGTATGTARVAGKTDSGGVNAGGLDFDSIRELALIADEFGLTEVEADPSGHIRIARAVAGAATDLAAVKRPAVPAIALAPPAPVEGVSEPGMLVSSPFVGTFYRAPSPDADVFVEVGQRVKKGQVVCIVEAMKLMNEIEAETDGKVAEILAKNGEHVEYGQGLIQLTPL